MAYQGDAEVFEIIGRQRGQNLGIDGVLAECRLILFKPQALQPRRDIHRRFLRLGIAGNTASPGPNVYACSRKRLVLCPLWLDRFRSRMENHAFPRWRTVTIKFSRNSARFRSLLQT